MLWRPCAAGSLVLGPGLLTVPRGPTEGLKKRRPSVAAGARSGDRAPTSLRPQRRYTRLQKPLWLAFRAKGGLVAGGPDLHDAVLTGRRPAAPVRTQRDRVDHALVLLQHR